MMARRYARACVCVCHSRWSCLKLCVYVCVCVRVYTFPNPKLDAGPRCAAKKLSVCAFVDHGVRSRLSLLPSQVQDGFACRSRVFMTAFNCMLVYLSYYRSLHGSVHVTHTWLYLTFALTLTPSVCVAVLACACIHANTPAWILRHVHELPSSHADSHIHALCTSFSLEFRWFLIFFLVDKNHSYIRRALKRCIFFWWRTQDASKAKYDKVRVVVLDVSLCKWI
jgi:hypothetical protein